MARLLGTEADLLRQAREQGVALAEIVRQLTSERPTIDASRHAAYQLDLSGAEHRIDTQAGSESLKLFEPVAEQLAGQTDLSITNEGEER